MQRSLGVFLAELRPTVALFLRFDGIDYDSDDRAGEKLDAYIRWVQQVAVRFEGTLIDLNIGDKGSYLYINYGALMAHEDSSARALSSALALQSPPTDLAFVGPVQIGISRGRMRVGAYGGRAHRTYGALGAEVNMAASLMMAAAPGETLVSQHAAWAAGNSFVYQEMSPIRAKGRAQMLIAYRLLEARSFENIRLDAGMRDGPLVGRQSELRQMENWLHEATAGHGKIIAIRGDTGVGKSRFAAEVLRIAEAHEFGLYGGECQSYGVNANYLAWQPIWRGLLEIDTRLETEPQTVLAGRRLDEIDPSFEPRAPLLGALFNLPFATTS